jgi:hypothetical protein
MRAALALALLLLMGGCAALPIAAGMGALSAATHVPTWITLANDAITGIKILSQAAQLACQLQAVANSRGDSQTSTATGYFCSW